MSSNDNFENLIKEKLDSFEVPYNEDHWMEFESKLDAAGTSTSSGTEWSASGKLVAALSVVTAGAILYFSLSDSPTEISNDQQPESSEMNSATPIEENEEVVQEETTTYEMATEEINTSEIENEKPSEKSSSIRENKDSILESKINKYSDRSSTVMKSESKNFVDEAAPSDAFVSDIKVDNLELKTSFSMSTDVVCRGAEVTFTPDHIIEGAKYFWSVNDGDLTLIGKQPVRKFNREGSYTVTLIVSKGEKNDYKVSKDIRVVESPVVNFEWDEQNITLYDPYIEFTNLTKNAKKYEWNIGGEKFKDENPDYIFNQHNGHVQAELVAYNEAGCSSKKSVEIYVEKGNKMHVQNSFTPDGDGLNDVFIPEELKISENSNVRFEFMIFDLKGQLVFKTSDVSNPWNGQVNNTGEMLPEGIYSWTLAAIDRKGVTQQHGDKINLIRNQ